MCFYLSDSQLLVTDVMSQPLDLANVLVESAYAVASKSIILSQAPFILNEYVLLEMSVSFIAFISAPPQLEHFLNSYEESKYNGHQLS